MLGILYDNGDVCLAGDKNNLSKPESFTVLSSFAKLFKKVILLIDEKCTDIKAGSNFEKGMKEVYVNAFLSMSSQDNNLYGEALQSLKSHIYDDKFVFKIEENNNWDMSIIANPYSVSSLLNTIIYCMIVISTDICGDPYYLLKYIDIVSLM